MSIEGSRIGRQSNLFKHKIVELQRQGLIRPQILNMLATNTNPHGSQRTSNVHRKRTKQRTNFSTLSNESDVHFQQILYVENAFLQHLKDLPLFPNETSDCWSSCFYQLDEYSNRVGEFLEKIPQLFALNPDDKNVLIRSSTNSVIVFCLCLNSSRSSTYAIDSSWNFLNVSSGSTFVEYLRQNVSFFFDFHRSTSSFEKELQFLQLDEKEIGLMIVLLITSIGKSSTFLIKILFFSFLLANSKLNEFDRIEQLQDEFFSILFDYMAGKTFFFFVFIEFSSVFSETRNQ